MSEERATYRIDTSRELVFWALAGCTEASIGHVKEMCEVLASSESVGLGKDTRRRLLERTQRNIDEWRRFQSMLTDVDVND